MQEHTNRSAAPNDCPLLQPDAIFDAVPPMHVEQATRPERRFRVHWRPYHRARTAEAGGLTDPPVYIGVAVECEPRTETTTPRVVWTRVA